MHEEAKSALTKLRQHLKQTMRTQDSEKADALLGELLATSGIATDEMHTQTGHMPSEHLIGGDDPRGYSDPSLTRGRKPGGLNRAAHDAAYKRGYDRARGRIAGDTRIGADGAITASEVESITHEAAGRRADAFAKRWPQVSDIASS